MADGSMKVDAICKLAEFEASAAVESRAKLIDEHNAAFRWMIASLFALNGGAILSLFGSGNNGLQATLPAFWIFFLGIISTFLAVLFAQLSDRSMIARMHSWGLYWATVGVLAERDEEQEISIKAGIKQAERLGRWGRVQAVFAMLFFVLGILSVVVLEQKAEITKLEAKLDSIQHEHTRASVDR